MGPALRHRPRAIITLALAPALLGAGGDESTNVSVSVTGLRSAKGQVLGCLTTQAKGFPDCRKDPSARRLAVPASANAVLDFGRVPRGRYAVSLLHDENGNGKADMALFIPREGFGFSRDAPVRMGPPKFDSAAFDVAAADVRQTVRMRYMF